MIKEQQVHVTQMNGVYYKVIIMTHIKDLPSFTRTGTATFLGEEV